jgi:NADPH-dependent glutamate synthase beta subunit-like oxidoreductase
VNWYNGHPKFRDLPVDLSGKTAVIFGQGNVAVDCARILTKSVDELATTDISQHAVDVLRNRYNAFFSFIMPFGMLIVLTVFIHHDAATSKRCI